MSEYVLVDKNNIEDQPDDYEPIVEPEIWTLDEMIALSERTAQRFSFRFVKDSNGKLAQIRYVNYDLEDGKLKMYCVHKPKQKKILGSFILKDPVTKQVVIQ